MMNLSRRLKKLRSERKMTLDELSQKANVAKATICRIENGQTQGTLRTHLKICQALGVNIKELYIGTNVMEGEVTTFQPDDHDEAELFTYDEKASSIILTSGLAKKNILPQLLILKPGGKTHLEENPRGTEKFIFGLEGSLEVTIADVTYTLTKGGALYFKSSLPHFVSNVSQVEAKCLCITSPVAL